MINLRRQLPLLALALLLALPAAGALAAPTPSRALVNLNDWRVHAHEPKLKRMRADLNRDCAKHNNYMHLNGLTHFEVEGRPGYSAAGNHAGLNSVLADGERLPRQTWEAAVYHRVALLQPRLRVSGFSASHGFSCMNIYDGVNDSARSPHLKLYPWPANGAVGVPTGSLPRGSESPDPYAEAPGANHLGYLLSVDVNGPWQSFVSPRSKISSATLTDAGHHSVPVAISDGSTVNGPYLAGGFGIFPKRPLAHHTDYVVHVKGSVEDTTTSKQYPFKLRWHFRTARRHR